MTPDRASAARELLNFYAEAGVDALVGETPADRLTTAQASAAPVEEAALTPERQPVTRLQPSQVEMAPLAAAPAAPAPDIAVMAARETARSAASLTPTRQGSQICLPFIQRQIELATPDVLVCLGGPASQTLLGIKEGIKRARGRWFNFHTGTREIRAIATFHPAYLLRSPLEKRFAWRDFLAIKKALQPLVDTAPSG